MALTKTAQTLKFFAQRYREKVRKGIPRKLLVKMCYVSDLFAHEHWGESITDLQYYVYDHGPYDSRIVEYVDELVVNDFAEIRIEIDGDYEKKRLVDLGVPLALEFSEREREVLDYVANNYLFMSMNDLMQDVVYRSRPWVEATPRTKKKLLPMHIVDREKEKAVGFSLDELLRAEKEIAAGHFVTEI